jgi:hypothetical protein
MTCTRVPGAGDVRVQVRFDALEECSLDASGFHTPTDAWIAAEQAGEASEEQARRAHARAAHQPLSTTRPRRIDPHVYDITSLPSPPTSPASPPPLAPAAPHIHRPQPPALRRTRCPYCEAAVIEQTAWPNWYRSPAGTTAVCVCSACGLILGAAAGG